MQLKLVVVNNRNQYKWATVNSLCPVINTKELAMVNLPSAIELITIIDHH